MKARKITTKDRLYFTTIGSIFIYFFSGIFFLLKGNFGLLKLLLMWLIIILVSLFTIFAYNWFKKKYDEKINDYYTAFSNWFYSIGINAGLPEIELKKMLIMFSANNPSISPDKILKYNFGSGEELVKRSQMSKESIYSTLEETAEKIEDDYAYYLATKILLPFPVAIALMFGNISEYGLVLVSIISILIPILLEFKNSTYLMPEEIIDNEKANSKLLDSEKLLQIYSLIEKGYSSQEAIANLLPEDQCLEYNVKNSFFYPLEDNSLFSFNLLHPLLLILFSLPTSKYQNLFPVLIGEVRRFEKQIKTISVKQKVLNFRNLIMGIIGIFSLSTYFNLSPFFHLILSNHEVLNSYPIALFFSIIFSLSIMLSLLDFKNINKNSLITITSIISWLASFWLVRIVFSL